MTSAAPQEPRDLQDRDVVSKPLTVPPSALIATGIAFHGLEPAEPMPLRAWLEKRRRKSEPVPQSER